MIFKISDNFNSIEKICDNIDDISLFFPKLNIVALKDSGVLTLKDNDTRIIDLNSLSNYWYYIYVKPKALFLLRLKTTNDILL